MSRSNISSVVASVVVSDNLGGSMAENSSAGYTWRGTLDETSVPHPVRAVLSK